MYTKFDPKKRYFFSVALGLIVAGAGIAAFGIAEWFLDMYSDFYFANPSLKIVGGLIILALGYVNLELELSRVGDK
jgi:hypothetical protein